MLWKCCTQYVSKFGKLSSGHRTGKGQFSFQSQRKAMPKNAQTTTQLHSSHNGFPLQYSCLENPIDGGAWWATVHGVAKNQTRLSNFHSWKLLVYTLLKASLQDFEHNLASIWNECNFLAVWTFLGIVLLWDWNENWPFPVLQPLLSLSNLLTYWVQHFNSNIF